MKQKVLMLLIFLGLILSIWGTKEAKIAVKNNQEKASIEDETIVEESSDVEENIEKEVEDESESKMPESIDDEVEVEDIAEPKLELEGFSVCIDAGHGISHINKQEPIAPNSNETKPAFVSGTRGQNQTEEELNLKVAKKLEQKLKELGAEVYMTRTEAKTDMSNIDRAKFANELNVDIAIRIHADGNSDSSVHGVSMLVPTNKYIEDEDLVEKSQMAGEIILTEVVEQTGAKNRGIIKHSEMTGFNWSKVPVVLLEMGFMTNPQEDKLLETDQYQNKIVEGIAAGLTKYWCQARTY